MLISIDSYQSLYKAKWCKALYNTKCDIYLNLSQERPMSMEITIILFLSHLSLKSISRLPLIEMRKYGCDSNMGLSLGS